MPGKMCRKKLFYWRNYCTMICIGLYIDEVQMEQVWFKIQIVFLAESKCAFIYEKVVWIWCFFEPEADEVYGNQLNSAQQSKAEAPSMKPEEPAVNWNDFENSGTLPSRIAYSIFKKYWSHFWSGELFLKTNTFFVFS